MDPLFVWARRNAQEALSRWANPRPKKDASHYREFIKVINPNCFMVEGQQYMFMQLRELKIKYPEDIHVIRGVEMFHLDLLEEWRKAVESSRSGP